MTSQVLKSHVFRAPGGRQAQRPPDRRVDRWTTLALGLALGVALAACTDPGTEEPPAEQPRPVQTLTLEDPDRLAGRSFTSRVEAQHRAWVSFRVGGELDAVHADVGDTVAAGEELARLDDDDYAREVAELEARLEGARAREAYAATEYLRAEELVEDGVITESEYDQAARRRDEARADTASLRAGLALAQNQLRYTRLKAPFGGVIAERRFEPGEAVTAGDPVFLVEDLSQLEAVIGIPEELMVYRNHLHDVRVRIPALGTTYPASVRTVGVDIPPERQTYPVVVTLEDTEGEVMPGMTAEVIVRADPDLGRGLRVPLTALHEHEGEPHVWLRDADGDARRQRVAIAALDGRSALIKEGLAPGDEVVTAGVHHLREGQPTRRMDREGL